MRSLLTILAAGLAGLSVWAAEDAGGKVEVKGPHLCCGQCVKIAKGLLKDIPGVSDVDASQKTVTISFTAKDAKAVQAGLKAISNGGFYGSATVDGKETKMAASAAKAGEKADNVAVKNVHVCCGACQKAINKLFPDAKVTYEGKGPQRTVRVEGNGLDKGAVLESLRKTGFNGIVE